MQYDIAVIGGGPGGYVAAIRAAQLGAKVLVAEKEKLGGVCLNRGCIPTKTLLQSAKRWEDLKNCAEYGLWAENIGFDFAAVMDRKDKVVTQLQTGIVQLLKSHGITVVQGSAALTGENRLAVIQAEAITTYEAGKIIIATGSRPMRLPVPGGDLPGVVDSDALLDIAAVPRSMVVIGAGAVGIEFAAVFRSFGCEVTVVEMLPAILPSLDSDIVKRMALSLRKSGLKMLTGARVREIIRKDDGELAVVVETGKGEQQISAEKVLVASGRRPLTDRLGLDSAGVKYDAKGIAVDEKMGTNIPGIFAIGDVTGRYMWAHAASAAGLVAAENAMGGELAMDFSAVPGCIYTTPEIAAVGLTEQQAADAGKSAKVSRFNFAANGKAVSMNEPDGFVKIVAAAEDGKVLGMHIMGPHASDLIMEGVLAIKNKLTASQLAQSIHPHPSLAEAVMECAHGIDGDMIHQIKLKR